MILFIQHSGKDKTIDTEVRSVIGEAGDKIGYKETGGIFRTDRNIQYLDVVVVKWLYKDYRNSCNCTPKKGDFTAHKLCLHKLEKNQDCDCVMNNIIHWVMTSFIYIVVKLLFHLCVCGGGTGRWYKVYLHNMGYDETCLCKPLPGLWSLWQRWPSSCPCVFTAEHTGGAGGTVEGLREEGMNTYWAFYYILGLYTHQPF